MIQLLRLPSLADLALLCVIFHFLAGELFSNMVLFYSHPLNGSKITPEFKLSHHHRTLKISSETSGCGWQIPNFQLSESCDPILLIAWVLNSAYAIFYCIIVFHEEYTYLCDQHHSPCQGNLQKRPSESNPFQAIVWSCELNRTPRSYHSRPTFILLFVLVVFS